MDAWNRCHCDFGQRAVRGRHLAQINPFWYTIFTIGNVFFSSFFFNLNFKEMKKIIFFVERIDWYWPCDDSPTLLLCRGMCFLSLPIVTRIMHVDMDLVEKFKSWKPYTLSANVECVSHEIFNIQLCVSLSLSLSLASLQTYIYACCLHVILFFCRFFFSFVAASYVIVVRNIPTPKKFFSSDFVCDSNNVWSSKEKKH